MILISLETKIVYDPSTIGPKISNQPVAQTY